MSQQRPFRRRPPSPTPAEHPNGAYRAERPEDNFYASYRAGRAGEDTVIAWWRARGVPVVDVRRDRAYQDAGVDALVGATQEGVDIKTDRKDSPNLFLEEASTVGVTNPQARETEGAVLKARWLAYYMPARGELFLVDNERAAVWLAGAGASRHRHRVPGGGVHQDYVSVGVAVPITELRELGIIRRTYTVEV